MDNTTNKFKCWCIIELFGHAKMAGFVSEASIAGGAFIQVDVPATDSDPAYTRFLGPAAIYAINPVDEETARAKAQELAVRPVTRYEMRSAFEKYLDALPAGEPTDEEDFFVDAPEFGPEF